MKSFSVFVCALVVSCGGTQRSETREVADFDPELYEVCLMEGASPAELACTHRADGAGRMTWGFPLGPTAEWAHMKASRNVPDKTVMPHLLATLIARPRSFICQGSEEGCEKLRLQVACEAQVARTMLVRSRIAEGDGAGALRLIGEVVRAGSAHYRYEDVPAFLEEVKPLLPSAMIATCLAAYEAPEAAVVEDAHWRPYTEDDPAPSW